VKVRIPGRRFEAWRFTHRLLLIAGILGLGCAAYSYAARFVYQAYENREFDRALSAKNFVPPSPHGLARPSAESPRALIGRIAIPRLSISAMVKEGVDDGTLGLAVGHIPSTALPGEIGNIGLAAHRDNLFRNLKGIALHDEITMTTLDAVYTYRVTTFSIVGPGAVSVLAPSAGEKTLTLVTCYPFYFVGRAPKRFVVHAVQTARAQ